MKTKTSPMCIPLAVMLCAACPAFADDAATVTAGAVESQARHLDRDVVGQGPARVERRVGADFTDWAGSSTNASSLVDGLRTGKAITLISGTESTTFVPPTRPMGYGNTYISLALAKAQLAAQGITSPTPLQLQAALMGNPANGTRGVLALRSEGKGWGRIAQAYDLKLGPVMSGLKAAHESLNPSQTTTPSWTRSAARTTSGLGRSGASQGIVTAGGTPAAVSGGKGLVTAGSAPAAATPASVGHRGIMTASGGMPDTSNGQGRGHFR